MNPHGRDPNTAKIHGLPTEVTELVSALNEAQILDVLSQKEFREKQSDKKWIYSERNTVRRVWAIAEGEWAPNCGMVSFYGLGK